MSRIRFKLGFENVFFDVSDYYIYRSWGEIMSLTEERQTIAPGNGYFSSKQKVLAIVLAVILSVVSFSSVLDRLGEEATGELLLKTTAVYAVTRGVMAAINMASEVELGVSIVVAEGTVKPFRFLTPINDFLERFSEILLLAITSLGILKLLTFMFGSTAVSALYSAVLIACVVLFWLNPPESGLRKYAPFRIFMMATVIRFAFVLIVGMNFLVHHMFLDDRQEETVSALQERARAVDVVTNEVVTLAPRNIADADDDGDVLADEATSDVVAETNWKFWEKSSGTGPAEPTQKVEEPGFFSRMGDALNPTRLVSSLKEKAGAVVDSVIDASVLFLLQGLVIPLIFIGIVLAAIKRLSP